MKKSKLVLAIIIGLLGSLLITNWSLSNQSSEGKQLSRRIDAMNKKFTYHPKATYNLYLSLLGNVGVIQINSIKDGHIDANSPYVFNFKKKGMNAHSLIAAQSNVFVSIYDDAYLGKNGGIGAGNQVAVLHQNKIIHAIHFPNHHGLSAIMLDAKHNKAYVMCAVQPAPYNPKGTPFVTFSTKSQKQLNTIHIKGIVAGTAEHGDDMVMAVYGAKKLGYKSVPDQYIAIMNRKTNHIDILTQLNKDRPHRRLRDLAASGHQLYVLTSDSSEQGELDIYDLKGALIKKIPLSKAPSHLILNKNGMLFISFIGTQYDGKQVTVFNTKTNDVVTHIDGFEGAGHMVIKDHYLFVDNEGKASVSVVDMTSFKIIGTLNFGFNQGSSGLVVIRNN